MTGGELLTKRVVARPARNPYLYSFAALTAFAALSGCKTPALVCFKSSGLQSIAISSNDASNGGRPIAVDLVFTTNKPVAQAISQLKSADYFQRREQIARDFPKGYIRQSWELQAGQFLKATPTGAPCNLVGTFIFARYASEGDHRLRLEKTRAGMLVLGGEDFSWIPEKR